MIRLDLEDLEDLDKGKDLVKVEMIKIQCIELVHHLQDLPRQEVQDGQEVKALYILANSIWLDPEHKS